MHEKQAREYGWDNIDHTFKTGNLKTMDELCRRFGSGWQFWDTAIRGACESGNIQLVETTWKWMAATLSFAKLTEMLDSEYGDLPLGMLNSACRSGNTEVIEWVIAKTMKYHGKIDWLSAVQGAMAGNHLVLVDAYLALDRDQDANWWFYLYGAIHSHNTDLIDLCIDNMIRVGKPVLWGEYIGLVPEMDDYLKKRIAMAPPIEC